MSVPSWALALLCRLAPPADAEDVLGDLEEAHRARVKRRGRYVASILTGLEALDMARALIVERVRSRRTGASRGLRLVGQIRFSWLDVKLGLRMLRKHPGLTIVAVFALGVAIPTGLVPLHLGKAFEAPLPVPEGERIQAVRYWHVAGSGFPNDVQLLIGGRVRDLSYYEFIEWRDELRSFSSLAAIDDATYSLSSPEGAAPPVSGARVTASAFDVLRIQPLLGRPLVASDEVVGAPRVVVVGYDLWQSRLGGDPDVMGQTLRISGEEHTVVGIMPEGFRFPEQQQLWLPLRVNAASDPAAGPFLRVFGRLADGASAEQANAEIASLGRGMSAAFPDVREGLRAEVVPFGFTTPGVLVPPGGVRGEPAFLGLQLLALVLLVVACANVALLIFARSATRFREVAVRTALGASRLRILSQMLAESLVLALLATGVGLFAADQLLSRISRLAASPDFDFRLPYWLDLGLTWEAALWGLVLALFSSVIAGVIPALRITGRAVQQNIQRAGFGLSGVRFGKVTTVLIVADLALALPIVGLAVVTTESLFETRVGTTIGAQADEYLAVELQLPTGRMVDGNGEIGPASYRQRVAATERALVERLRREPEVRAVAAANVLPRMSHPGRPIALEDPSTVPKRYLRGPYVNTSEARVGPGYFDAFDQPLLAGRGFVETDVRGEASPVIVNAAFVDTYLGGRNAVGRRLRFETQPNADEPPPWREIVGVVGRPAFAGDGFDDGRRIYLPKAPGEVHPLRLAIHLDVPPERFEPRVRDIVAEVDPAAAVTTLGVLGEMVPGDWYLDLAFYAGLGSLILILLSLAVSGLYAVMSFAVTERTREIGIRTALGAGRGRIAVAILGRAACQVGLGALVGTPLMVWLFFFQNELIVRGTPADLVLGAMVPALGSVVTVALLACSAPTLRAMRVEPTEALRAEE